MLLLVGSAIYVSTLFLVGSACLDIDFAYQARRANRVLASAVKAICAE